MKFIKFFILALIFLSAGLSTIKAQETPKQENGISISPAQITIYKGIYNYEITITNNYSEEKKFEVKTDILDNIDINLAKKQSIAPFVYFDQNSFSLKPGEKKAIKINLNSDIDNITNSLYGKVLIITKNSSTQTTIDHGFGINLIRNSPSVLGEQAPFIEIKAPSFTKSIFSFSNTADISFKINNKGDQIQKLFGEYSVIDNNGNTIFDKAITDFNYTLNPYDIKEFKDKVDVSSLVEKYTLLISITDGSGNLITKSSTELISINSVVLILVPLAVIILFILILKRKNISRFFKRRVIIKTINILVLFIFICSSILITIHAQSMQSTTYKIPESDFTTGKNSTSTTYQLRDEQGNALGGTSTSTSYGLTNGASPLYYAFVPPAATVSNNSNTYYDRLSLIINVGSNPSDSEFAVVVTSTGFAGVKYVKSDNTLTTTLDNNTGWRKYNSGSPSWGGGTGVIVSGLSSNTSYTFYVKSRQRNTSGCVVSSCNLPASETPVILLPSANATPNTTVSTTTPVLSFQIIGVSAGGVNTITSTSTGVNYGILSSGTPQVASNTLRVTTNAFNGYNVNMSANQKLQSGTSFIDWFTSGSATYATPQTWASPTSSYPNAGWIGYTVSDTDLTQFTSTKFAPFPVSPTNDIVTTSTTQNTSAQDNNITYKIEINSSQPAGNYSGMTITYILTGTF